MDNLRIIEAGKVSSMAKANDRDSYKKLVRVMSVLIVLVILAATAWVLIDKQIKGLKAGEDLKTKQINDARTQAYNDALAEQENREKTGQSSSTWPLPKAEGWDVVDLSGFAVEESRTVPVTRKDMLTSGLLLINRWHELPSDFSEETLASVGKTTNYRVPVTDSNVRLFPVAVTALDTMLTAAKADGVEFYIIREGYRTMEVQTAKWQDEIAKLQSRFSGNALTDEALKYVAYPGTSDYQSGMSFAIDVYNKDDSALNAKAFQITDQAKWLNEHCWEYGFIFRFPIQGYPDATVIDKSYKTGINLKLDVYRYVGVPHAAVMHILNLCLEEYVEYLGNHPHIAVYRDGNLVYEIVRKTGFQEDATLALPDNEVISVSLDNMNGLVCALGS
jgi:zinc D-Ala-D-Ala carboxypeptidase